MNEDIIGLILQLILQQDEQNQMRSTVRPELLGGRSQGVVPRVSTRVAAPVAPSPEGFEELLLELISSWEESKNQESLAGRLGRGLWRLMNWDRMGEMRDIERGLQETGRAPALTRMLSGGR